MPRFLTLDDLDAKGKRVLVRADLNVPVKDGRVADPTRIARLAPTIRELAEKGAVVVVISHFGRPKGKPDPALSLKPLAQPLSEALQRRRRLRRGLHRAPGQGGGRRAEAGRDRALGKPSLPQGRGIERSGLRQGARLARRNLCRRRLLLRPPRPCLGRGGGASAAGLCRAADGGGVEGALRRARASATSGGGHRR